MTTTESDAPAISQTTTTAEPAAQRDRNVYSADAKHARAHGIAKGLMTTTRGTVPKAVWESWKSAGSPRVEG